MTRRRDSGRSSEPNLYYINRYKNVKALKPVLGPRGHANVTKTHLHAHTHRRTHVKKHTSSQSPERTHAHTRTHTHTHTQAHMPTHACVYV